MPGRRRTSTTQWKWLESNGWNCYVLPMPAELGIVLITGASGFVGRHLSGALSAQGKKVRGAARSVPVVAVNGVSEWVTVEKIGPDTDWSTALQGVTTIIHLAALAHQTDPRHQPGENEFM